MYTVIVLHASDFGSRAVFDLLLRSLGWEPPEDESVGSVRLTIAATELIWAT